MGLLDGKVAIVTGAGHGIGRGEALELAAHGAQVVVNDLGTSLAGQGNDQGVAEVVSRLIRSRGGEAVADFEDVADWEGAGRLVRHAIKAFGHLDILVNNAAIFRDKHLDEMSEDDWDSVVRVHLKGTAATMFHAVNYWKGEGKAGRRRNASIINTTSRAGLLPNQSQVIRPSYVAAKAAVAALTVVASLDYYEDGIRVNALSPSAYTRGAAQTYGQGSAKEPDEYEGFDRVDPSTNAPLVAYLGSDRSLHVTGQVFRMHYGNSIIHMQPWRYGETITTEGRWDPETIGRSLDMKVFGCRAPSREDRDDEMVRVMHSERA